MDSASAKVTSPGDFLDLLSHHGLAPVHGRVTEQAPPQTQATTVFAFHCADGVLMAGDRRATAGHMIVSQQVDKVLTLDAYSLLAIAGVPAMAFEMARVLQSSFEYFRRSQLQSLSLPAKVRTLARLLKDNLPLTLQGVGVVAPLFAGLDERAKLRGPKIYFYDPLGAQFQAVGYAASGSGATAIRSVLHFHQRSDLEPVSSMDRAEAVRFALRLLNTASEMDAATGGVDPVANRFASMKLLLNTGVEDIDAMEQKRHWVAAQG